MTHRPDLPEGVNAVPAVRRSVPVHCLQRARPDGTVEEGRTIGLDVVLSGDSWVSCGAAVLSGSICETHVPPCVTVERSVIDNVDLTGFRGTLTDVAACGFGRASVLASSGATNLRGATSHNRDRRRHRSPAGWELGAGNDQLPRRHRGAVRVATARLADSVEVEIVNLTYGEFRSLRVQLLDRAQLAKLMATLSGRFHAPEGATEQEALVLLETAVWEMLR